MAKNWGQFYSKLTDFDFLVQNANCHLPFFKSILNENPKRILEIGAGTGSMSIFLSYLGIEVTTLDNDRLVLKNAQALSKKYNGKTKFVFGDGFKMKHKANSFDVCFHQGLLEHFSDEDIYRLLDEQLRVAKFAVLSVPNNLYPKQDFGDERLMSKEEWEKLLLKKYQIIESFEYNPFTKIILGGRFIRKIFNTMYLAKIKKK